MTKTKLGETISIVAFYLLCWTLTWSALLADCQATWPERASVKFRQDLGFSMLIGALPPVWVLAPFLTGFYEHGFQFRRSVFVDGLRLPCANIEAVPAYARLACGGGDPSGIDAEYSGRENGPTQADRLTGTGQAVDNSQIDQAATALRAPLPFRCDASLEGTLMGEGSGIYACNGRTWVRVGLPAAGASNK